MEVWGRRRGFVVLTLMLLGMVRYGAVGRFVVEKSSITLVSPYHLSSKHDAAIGNFGIPDYGGTMMGSVVYLSQQPTGCKHIDRADLKSDESKSSRRHPIILLVDRGECYFAVKVWNGQQAGAAAVLVADNVNEPLITMDTPDENTDTQGYIQKIVIPTALIDRSFGDTLKKSLEKGEDVLLKLDWTESVPHPDERVEFELWTNSNDECGGRCDEQMSFIKNFRGHAQLLEKGGYTHFTPHYITWYCPEAFLLSKQCRSQCINHGRYCAPDPEQKFKEGYEGKDVVLENLRQLCVHRVANESNRPWVWWDFVTDFHIRCSMKEQRYSRECAEDVTNQLNLPVEKIKKCMGDPEADEENPILKAEQDLQIGRGSRGDITILPTLVINNVQYRGKLERSSVLKAVCSGFKETTDPPVCLNGDLETNECLEEGNGGCWVDKRSNITACKDTFRGRVCQCPVVNGVQFRGDGYLSCEAVGPARCTINNGGCWSETRNGDTFSACTENELIGCRCPFGFRGDGLECEDIDECAEGFSCQCDGCTCSNTWGGYDCKCKGNLIYIMEQDTCIGRLGSRFGWFLNLLLLAGVMGAGIAGYVFYKYRLRSYMDSEIMAIMSQYMPLDNQQNEVQQPRPGSSV